MTGVLMRRGHRKTQREESHVKAEADRSDAWKPRKAKDRQQAGEAGRKHGRTLPWSLQGVHGPCQHLDFRFYLLEL